MILPRSPRLDQATDCLGSRGKRRRRSEVLACLDLAWPDLNLLSAMMTNVQRDWVSELGLSMSTRQKHSNAALETCLLILFRNARDLELQLHELKKLRD